MEIAIVRLTTGEELIGEYNPDPGTERDEIEIVNPFIIIPTGDGKISTMQYMPYAKNVARGLLISKQFVMFVVVPHEQLVDGYREMTGQIITPPSQIIT